jgi:hypothetical protein
VERLVELPDRGRLFVGTDLQGHLADFERLVSVFEEAAKGPGGAVLVLTGDLVHGPEIPEENWPEYLGSHYRADSAALLARAEELAERHPGRVFYLLGNHEHAHIGGPVVSKFFADEAERLERIMGPKRAAQVKRWFRSWPFVAVARRAGLCMLHAAPNAALRSPDELAGAALEPAGALVDPVLAEILWARTASSERARDFLRTFDERLTVAVYGHDVVREGWAIDREPLLCLSTSFGCYDGDKVYLEWDLAVHAESAAHVARVGVRPLYPDARPVYRRQS